MRARSILLSLATGAVISTAAVVASAEVEAPPVQKPIAAFPFYAGIMGGAGYATLQHPFISKEVAGVGGSPVSFTAATLGLHLGYTFTEHLSAGLEFQALETGISRNNAGETFKLGYSTQAGCNNCHGRPQGTDILGTTIVFSTFAARLEYTPFGRDGLFVGASGGLASIVGYDDKLGVGFSGRLGYRFRPTNIMTISLEGGVQGQVYGDANLYMPYGAAVLRPYF